MPSSKLLQFCIDLIGKGPLRKAARGRLRPFAFVHGKGRVRGSTVGRGAREGCVRGW